jgi:MFS family permease
MPRPSSVHVALTKRLTPLYVAAFFQSFVLWYAVEKLFMQSIGFSNAGIGIMVALYSAVMLVVETPSGILADRWSRKGVLILASMSLVISGVIGGLSHSVGAYLLATVFWGTFFACYSGMFDSIVYDTLIEVTGESKLFDFYYGRIQLLDSLGLVTSGIVGGIVASILDLRAAYFLSIPLAFVAVIALLKFKEPTLHKSQAIMKINVQIATTFRAILYNRTLIPVIVVLVTRAAAIYILYEFYQLWFLPQHLHTVYYGLTNAIIMASIGAGGIFATRLKLYRYVNVSAALFIMLLAGIGLVVFRNIFLIIGAQFLLGTGLTATEVIFSRLLHNQVSTAVRAGAVSASGTIGRFFIVPLALLFGYISNQFSIYKAGYFLFILTAVMAVFVVVVANRDRHTGLEPK